MVRGHGKNDYFRRSELLDNAIRYLAKPLNLPSEISSQAAIDQPQIVAKAIVQPSPFKFNWTVACQS